MIPENMKADEVNPMVYLDFSLEAFSGSTLVLLSWIEISVQGGWGDWEEGGAWRKLQKSMEGSLWFGWWTRRGSCIEWTCTQAGKALSGISQLPKSWHPKRAGRYSSADQLAWRNTIRHELGVGGVQLNNRRITIQKINKTPIF